MSSVDGLHVFIWNASGDPAKGAAVEQRAKLTIPNLTSVKRFEDIEKIVDREIKKIFLLVVINSTEREYFTKLLEVVTRYKGRYFFILVGGDISAADYKRLVQSGNADWVSESAPGKEILDIIIGARGGSEKELINPKAPVVIAFVPSAGGVGNSTLAIETAVHLRKSKLAKSRSICLVDLDFQTSHLCDYFDIDPQLQIDEIMGAPQRLDSQLLDIYTSRHASGIDIFAAPRAKRDHRELNLEGLDGLFSLIAQRYEFILIDLPVAWSPWTLHVLKASQAIVVTGINTIPCLRQIYETLEAVRKSVSDTIEIRVALNKCEIGLMGGVARSNHVSKVLRDESPFFVRHSAIAIESVNTGSPMSIAYPTHKVVKDIRLLANFCGSLKVS